MKDKLRSAASALLQAGKIVLAGHVNPDGDTLGCILAVGHALRTLGKDTVIISNDGVPDIYRWMPGSDQVVQGSDRHDFDLAIVCDAGALDRVGRSVVPVIQSAPLLMDIDHHVAEGTIFGDYQLLDSTAAATAEIIWLLILELSEQAGRDLRSFEIAECLMTGLITDTGSFRFPNTTPRTFHLAANLQELGAMPAPINELVFENRSFASLKLLGRALKSLQTIAGGQIAWAHVTADDFIHFGADDADTEGIVQHVRAVKTAKVGMLFREIPGQKIRISLRARAGADVNAIAAAFGGGGHRLAAGCSVDKPLAIAEELVVAEALRHISDK